MRDTHREAEIQAEGEASSLQEAQHGTQSQDPGSHPEPKADAQPLSHPCISWGSTFDIEVSLFSISTMGGTVFAFFWILMLLGLERS